MARAAKTIKTPMPATPARKAARPAPVTTDRPKMSSAAAKRTAAAATKSQKQVRAVKAPVAARAVTPAPKPAARVPAAPPAPKVSKDELRAQVEKLQNLVTTLRAKSREMNKAAKATSAHILELETQVADLEQKAAAVPAADPEPKKLPRAKRQGRKPDTDAPNVEAARTGPLDDNAHTTDEDAPTTGEHD